MNRFLFDICEEWEREKKDGWIGAEDSSERRRFDGMVSVIADRGPDETDVLIDSFCLSDETISAFRRGEPEKFMRCLVLDALNRKLSRIRRNEK